MTPPLPPKSCRLWDKVEKCCRAGRSEMTIWRMRISCWIPKATDTLPEFVILIVVPLQQWLDERASKCYVILSLPVVWFVTQFSYTSRLFQCFHIRIVHHPSPVSLTLALHTTALCSFPCCSIQRSPVIYRHCCLLSHLTSSSNNS